MIDKCNTRGFHIGSDFLIYRYCVSADPLHDEGGNPRAAEADENRRLFTLSPTVRPSNRAITLAHEVAHAWLWHCGTPADVESLCDLMATAMIQFHRDLLRNGGVDAITRLRPRRPRHSKRVTAAIHR